MCRHRESLVVCTAVDGGERAVIFDRFEGVKKQTTGEGTHILVPWLQKPFVMDIRTRPRSISSVTGTKDLQMVNITVRVLSRPKIESLPQIFRWIAHAIRSLRLRVWACIPYLHIAQQPVLKRS